MEFDFWEGLGECCGYWEIGCWFWESHAVFEITLHAKVAKVEVLGGVLINTDLRSRVV